jgi:hypothetical protein
LLARVIAFGKRPNAKYAWGDRFRTDALGTLFLGPSQLSWHTLESTMKIDVTGRQSWDSSGRDNFACVAEQPGESRPENDAKRAY